MVLGGAAPVSAQVDADEMRAVAKRNDCFKCHAIDKDKKGPSFKWVAAKYKTKPNALEKVITHITTGPMIQIDNGENEEHKVIDTKDPDELRKFAQWILSL